MNYPVFDVGESCIELSSDDYLPITFSKLINLVQIFIGIIQNTNKKPNMSFLSDSFNITSIACFGVYYTYIPVL